MTSPEQNFITKLEYEFILQDSWTGACIRVRVKEQNVCISVREIKRYFFPV